MKKLFLTALLLFGISNSFGVTVEKNDISIEYKKCRSYAVKIDYQIATLGSPYCITITNGSDKPIVVGASLIGDPMHGLNIIAKAIRYDWITAAIMSTIGTPVLGVPSFFMLKDIIRSHAAKPQPHALSQPETRTHFWEYSTLGATVVLGSLTTYLLYKLIRETEKVLEAKLAKDVLHSPVTIQPGKSVKKLFWLTNPKDQIKINFDAIKVLK